MENKELPFTDIGIFSGIVEYFDEDRDKWRREFDGSVFRFWKLENDAFLYEGRCVIKNSNHRKNIKHCHNSFLETIEDEEGDLT